MRAYEPFTEEGQVTGHTLYGAGSFVCQRTLPSHTFFSACFMEGGLRKMGCKSRATKGEEFGELSLKASCREGLHYTTKVWLWKVGEAAIMAMSAFGECEENLAEIGTPKILGG